MLQKTYADFQKDPFTGQYKKVGDKTLSVIKSTIDENILLFDNGGCVKKVKVVDKNNGFIYQIRKNFINAAGGAAGLYNFLERELRDSTTGGFYLTVHNKVFEYMN